MVRAWRLTPSTIKPPTCVKKTEASGSITGPNVLVFKKQVETIHVTQISREKDDPRRRGDLRGDEIGTFGDDAAVESGVPPVSTRGGRATAGRLLALSSPACSGGSVGSDWGASGGEAGVGPVAGAVAGSAATAAGGGAGCGAGSAGRGGGGGAASADGLRRSRKKVFMMPLPLISIGSRGVAW